MTPPPSLHISTVLYKNDLAAVERVVSSTVRAAELAREHGSVGPVSYAVGDCSPQPVLTDADVERVLTARAGRGVDEIRYEFFDKNLGHAEGDNALMRGVSADLFLLVNPDAYPSPRLLDELVVPLADPKVGIVEARQLPFEHPKYFDPTSGQTGWASMACCLIRGSVFGAVGELDSDCFWMYCDDVDYSWRVRLAGHRVVHRPAAVVFHDKRLATDGTVIPSATEEYYAAEAGLLLTHKYSRPDLTQRLLAQFTSGPPHHRKAAEAFRERERADRLPQPLDPRHEVAEFVDGNYTPHRF